jgi:CDP-glucose 4,6-dehydratase
VTLEKLADRDVLVTGHTGFKGAWLSLWLHRLGARVHGLALDPLTGSLFDRAEIATLLATDRRVDIRDSEALEKAMADVSPDVVIHLAAQPLVRESYLHPADTFSTNVTGTINTLLSALTTPSVASVLVITTDKVYRNVERQDPYREDDPLGGDDPYSASKACAEIATHSIRRSFGRPDVEITTVRSGNVLGGGDIAPDRLLPDLIASFSAGEQAVLRYPHAVRPWQHVLDPLHGYLLVVDAHLSGRSVPSLNFGPSPDDLMTVQEVADVAAREWGDDASVTVDLTGEHPHEAGLLLLDSGRALDEVGWQPAISGRQAVARTVEWYRSVQRGRPALDAMIDDLSSFG